MRFNRLTVTGSALIFALFACSGGNSGSSTTTGPTSTTGTNGTTATNGTSATTGTDSTTTSEPVTTTIGSSGCGTESPVLESGQLLSASEPASDAEQISAIGWVGQVGCEVFTIDFATDQGAPATTPPSTVAEFLREPGIVRVALDLEMTAITDQLAETVLVRQVFVARKADRTLFVDFHLAAPALVSVTTSSSPSRVTISLEPGGSDYVGVPAIGPNVVVVFPLEGPVEASLTIDGYSRNFEANTIGRVTQASTILAEGSTTAADWSETWGEFSLTLEIPGSGPADLFVGEQSAQDGSDRGVVIPVDLP